MLNENKRIALSLAAVGVLFLMGGLIEYKAAETRAEAVAALKEECAYLIERSAIHCAGGSVNKCVQALDASSRCEADLQAVSQ